MTKDQLRQHLAVHVAAYHLPIHTHAESVDQQKRLHKRLENRRKPDNLVQTEWERYIASVEAGTYRPEYKPEVQLYDYEGL